MTGCSSQLKYEQRDSASETKIKPQTHQSRDVVNKCKSSAYVVKAGDTLSGISHKCDVDMQQIAQINELLPPYIIYVNQELVLPNSAVTKVQPVINESESAQDSTQDIEEAKKGSNRELSKLKQEQKPSGLVKSTNSDKTITAKALNKPTKPKSYKNVEWQWPMHKGLTYKFRRDRAGLSVLEVYGVPGQEVRAVASGHVVYSGNGIANYGWMLVIKHDNDFMSIYAHNSALLVAEGETVKAGDKVALLGATGSTKRPKLYLEARYQGRKYDIKKKLKFN